MKRRLNEFFSYINYGGISKQEYREMKEEIYDKNRSALGATAGCLALMFAGLYIGSLFFGMMSANRMAYGITGLAFMVVHILCWVIKKRGKAWIIPLWYVTLTIVLAYAVILNTIIRNDISATTFCLIVIVAPLLIMDRPWRVFCYFVLVVCCFIPLDFHYKSYNLAFPDSVNAVCCIFMGSVIHFRIIRTKMQEMKQRRYIERERDTDALTGCFTKAAFERKMLEKSNPSMPTGILLVMDLDHFKSVNDTYGHVFGDMVLRTVGEYIQKNFPETAFCGRFGGDEFQVWIPGNFESREISGLLDKFLSCIRSIGTPDGRVEIAASIGGAVCPEDGNKYKTLFESADAALYAAKNMGRSRYVFCPKVRM